MKKYLLALQFVMLSLYANGQNSMYSIGELNNLEINDTFLSEFYINNIYVKNEGSQKYQNDSAVSINNADLEILKNKIISLQNAVREYSSRNIDIPNAITTFDGFINNYNSNSILEGITEFAIERSKNELNIAFFNKMKRFIEENKEAEILFPNTLQQFYQIKSFQFNEFLPKLRAAFFNDLNSFPQNIISTLSLPKYVNLFDKYPEINVAIQSYSIISRLNDKEQHISKIIADLANMDFPQNYDSSNYLLKNFQSTLKLTNAVSRVFTDSATHEYFNKKVLNDVLNDEILYKIYFSCIINNINREDIKFYYKENDAVKEIKLTNGLSAMMGNKYLIQAYLQKVINIINNVESIRSDFKNFDSLSPDQRRQLITNYISVSVQCVDIMNGLLNIVDIKTKTEPYLALSRTLCQIPSDVINQNYPSLVSNSVGFLNIVFNMASSHKNTDEDVITNKIKIFSQILKYANLAANIVESNNAKDVKNIIETVALPPGSSSIKKNSVFNISLQMHLGGGGNVKNWANSTTLPSWKSNLFVTLPIGVSFNTGLGKGGSLGLLSTIMDLGALAQFKINNGDSSISEKIRFQNIFSPGIYICYGLPFNVPLSLNMGCQYGPGLTKIKTNNNFIQKPSWRMQVSLTVDIPVFTIFNVAKGRTKTAALQRFE